MAAGICRLKQLNRDNGFYVDQLVAEVFFPDENTDPSLFSNCLVDAGIVHGSN